MAISESQTYLVPPRKELVQKIQKELEDPKYQTMDEDEAWINATVELLRQEMANAYVCHFDPNHTGDLMIRQIAEVELAQQETAQNEQ